MDTLAHTTLAKARLALVGLVLGGAALLGGAGEADGEVVEIGSFEEFLSVFNTQGYDAQTLRNYNTDTLEIINPFTRGGEVPEDNNYHLGFFEAGDVNNFVGFLKYPFSKFYEEAPEFLWGHYNKDELDLGNTPDYSLCIHDSNNNDKIMDLIGTVDGNGHFLIDEVKIDPEDQIWGDLELLNTFSFNYEDNQYQGPLEFNGEQDINQMPASSGEEELIIPSINLIPEASTLGLLAAGGMTSLFRRRKARREAR